MSKVHRSFRLSSTGLWRCSPVTSVATPCSFGFEGLRVGEVAFVDDIILWHGRRVGVNRKFQQLADELRRLGLSLNPEKCQVYRSPRSKDTEKVRMDGIEVPLDDHIGVMGYKLWTGIGTKEALKLARRKAGKGSSGPSPTSSSQKRP